MTSPTIPFDIWPGSAAYDALSNLGGTLSQEQAIAIADQAKADVKAAGGSEADANKAADEVMNFVNKYEPTSQDKVAPIVDNVSNAVDSAGNFLGKLSIGVVVLVILAILFLHEFNKAA